MAVGTIRWCTVASVSVQLSGFKELEARVKSIGERTPQALATALYEEANVVMADSKTNYVPVDQGTLSNSGRVDLPKVEGQSISVTFGFGGPAAPYAIWVHENPRSGKTMGVSPTGKPYKQWARRGQWKYLETPLKKSAPDIADAMRQALNDLFESRRAEAVAVATRF